VADNLQHQIDQPGQGGHACDGPRIQEAPMAGERRFRALIEHSFDAISLLAADGTILYTSPSSQRVSGRPPDEVVGQHAFANVHPDDVPRLRVEFARLLQMPGGSVTVECRCQDKDGHWRWLETTGTNLLHEPAVGAIVANFRDITQRKVAEQALRESELRYRELFEASPHPMMIFEWDSKRYVDVNAAAMRHYGYSREEFLRMTIFDLRPAEDVARLRKDLIEPTPPGQVGVWRHRKKDGTLCDVEIRGHWITLDGRRLRCVLAHDVTDRIRTEQALQASEAKYRSLIDNLELQIFLKDAKGRYVAANQRFCDAQGKGEAEIVGHSDIELSSDSLAARYQADDLRVLIDGERVVREVQVQADGKPRTFRMVKRPVKDEHGQVTGLFGFCWDVTDQRVLEAQLRQSQKMEAIGMLAGGVAHDFNNLLTVIVGNIALALGSLPENHSSRDLMLAAEQAGVQANELTNRLLGFARQTILRPVATHLLTCMEETVRILRRTVDPRITLQVRTPTDLWLVEADPAQINQVLLNLCLNARDAMPGGGLLMLEAANVVIDSEYVRQHVEARAGDYVRLSIGDTGHGIAEEIRNRIFEPFFTTKAAGKGTGLGLSLVFGIVKQHHGWIDFTSEINQGTRFDIFLPRHTHAVGPAATATPSPSPPRGGHETILLADDEPMIRQLGKTVLERLGYRVLLADDGLEAIEIYEQQRGKIDLVILDILMPRLSGHDALQHLLQIDPAVRVLLTSGYSPEHLDQAYHEHVLGFISKPFRPEQLARMVREGLDKRRGASPFP
jgi:PAS domain S-box-containing protein